MQLSLPEKKIMGFSLIPTIRDFSELSKFRLNLLVLVTTFIGFYLAAFRIDWELLAYTLFGTAFLGFSASMINQSIEIELDRKMERTKNRPLPAGRVGKRFVLLLALFLVISGALLLFFKVNALTAVLGLATFFSYLFLYTPLKTKSHLNTLVGAIPGAIPPVMGWTAVTNEVGLESGILFGILFLWQIPHFLAIAIMYKDDFGRGGFQMLPTVDQSGKHTSQQMVLYTLALVPVSLLLTLIGVTGLVYFVGALLFGLVFIWLSWKMAHSYSRTCAVRVFFFSIIYLPILLALMVFDKTLL